MSTLCIDTSAGASVALLDEHHLTLSAAAIADSRMHAESLTPLISRVCADAGFSTVASAGIETVVVGTGPAPFTGLRAGLVTARTLGWTLGAKVHGVCSLDGLARTVLDHLPPQAACVIVTDARRREVYAAKYQARGANDVECIWGPEVLTPAELARRIEPADCVAGAGANMYRDVLEPSGTHFAAGGNGLAPDAAQLARIAFQRVLAGAELGTEPLYLRRPDVHLK